MILEVSGDTFARNLAYLRKKYEVSYRALGRLSGVDGNILRGIERGMLYPAMDWRVFMRLGQIFNVTQEELTQIELAPPEQE